MAEAIDAVLRYPSVWTSGRRAGGYRGREESEMNRLRAFLGSWPGVIVFLGVPIVVMFIWPWHRYDWWRTAFLIPWFAAYYLITWGRNSS
jgi:hypothetical protein